MSTTLSHLEKRFGYAFFIVHKDDPANLGEFCLQKSLPIRPVALGAFEGNAPTKFFFLPPKFCAQKILF